ncbi:unnamed protein product, partial [Symbiodinium pilosum]
NEAAQMQELDEIWTQILVGRYPDLPIDSFLYAEDSPEFAEYLATLQSTHEFPKRLRKNDCKDKGNAWKILHEKFCIDHRVTQRQIDEAMRPYAANDFFQSMSAREQEIVALRDII